MRFLEIKEHGGFGSTIIHLNKADNATSQALTTWSKEQKRLIGRVPGHSYRVLDAENMVEAIIQSGKHPL